MGSNNKWDAEDIFRKYLHDYFVRKNMHKTADIFAKEANADISPVASAIDSPQGFLAEWWSIFHDVYFSMQHKHEEAVEKGSNKGKQVTGNDFQDLHYETSNFKVNPQSSGQLPTGCNSGSTLSKPTLKTYEQGNHYHGDRKTSASSQSISTYLQNHSKSGGSSQSNTQRKPRKMVQQRQDKKRVADLGSPPIGSSLCEESKTKGTGNVLSSAPLNGWPLIGASQIPPHLGHQVLNSYFQSANSQLQIKMPTFQSRQELFAQLLADKAAKALSPVPLSSDLEMLLGTGLDQTSGQLLKQIMGAAFLQNFNETPPLLRENLLGFGLQRESPEGDGRSLSHIKGAENALSCRHEEERILDESVEMFLSDHDDHPAHAKTSGIFQSDSRTYENNEHSGLGISLVEVGSLHASKGQIFSCNFSSDGRFLACAGLDKRAFIWNMDTLGYTSTLESHAHLVTDVQFDPSSDVFATSSFDRTVRLWDAARPSKSLSTLVGHNGHVMSLDFHPKKMGLLCSCDGKDEIRLWNIREYTCLRVLRGAIRQVRFQPQFGRLFASAAGNGVNIFDVETGDFLFDFKGHDSEVRSICWDVTGKYIASISEENIRLWSILSGGRCIHELHSKGNNFQSCTFHPGHPLLLVVGSYQSLNLWNPSQSSSVVTIQAHNGLVSSLAGSTPTGLIASASHDHCVKLWR